MAERPARDRVRSSLTRATSGDRRGVAGGSVSQRHKQVRERVHAYTSGRTWDRGGPADPIHPARRRAHRVPSAGMGGAYPRGVLPVDSTTWSGPGVNRSPPTSRPLPGAASPAEFPPPGDRLHKAGIGGCLDGVPPRPLPARRMGPGPVFDRPAPRCTRHPDPAAASNHDWARYLQHGRYRSPQLPGGHRPG